MAKPIARVIVKWQTYQNDRVFAVRRVLPQQKNKKVTNI